MQHEIVKHMFNDYFVRFNFLQPGVETSPKLDPSLAPDVHKLMLSTNLHPVKVRLLSKK